MIAASVAVRERPATYVAGGTAGDPDFDEATLTALWLLGRVPEAALPGPLLRAGRAGRGPGPDVREAAFRTPSGAVRAGDVEVHLRASDFVRHGHADDPAYAGVILHLVWEDDRPPAERGTPTPLPGGGEAVTMALAPVLGTGARLRAAVARGPAGREPCAEASARLGAETLAARVRTEGRRRLAERTWRAWRLADRLGWGEAWQALLDRALLASAGRRAESDAARSALVASIEARLGGEPLVALAALARSASPGELIEALRVVSVGSARAAEVGWNAVLPLLAASAASYDDIDLARATARLAERWPSPRPYGRTRALQQLVGVRGGGALHAQGLLHLQDLWCSRGGCGLCPLSAEA